MSLSISATAPTQATTAPVIAAAATQQTSQPQAQADTVILSLSAQAIQLNQQGQQAPQIALDLGIPVSKVESYLGIAAAAGA
jgi:hypothetical protein